MDLAISFLLNARIIVTAVIPEIMSTSLVSVSSKQVLDGQSYVEGQEKKYVSHTEEGESYGVPSPEFQRSCLNSSKVPNPGHARRTAASEHWHLFWSLYSTCLVL